VQIEACISSTVPESYVQTRLNLLTKLRELKALGGAKTEGGHPRNGAIQQRGRPWRKNRYVHRASPRHTLNHGAIEETFIFLNVAVNCGSRKVPSVFIDRGIPIELRMVARSARSGQAKESAEKWACFVTEASALRAASNIADHVVRLELADHRTKPLGGNNTRS